MCTSTPNWTAILESWWGPEGDSGPILPLAAIAAASNVVVGTNPPYYIQDFFANYPMFGGATQNAPSVTTTLGNAVATIATLPAAPGLVPGSPVAGVGIPDGTTIISVTGTGPYNITLSNQATASGTTALTVWNASPFPIFVILLYIALATACLVQARWDAQWVIAMGLFVAHYLTLWARADANPTGNLYQIAASGLAFGIQVSKSVGDVSVGYEAVPYMEIWMAWNLTQYGQLLATMAAIVGAGPMMLY
jgi:Protein of unknown function (DUF4054)